MSCNCGGSCSSTGKGRGKWAVLSGIALGAGALIGAAFLTKAAPAQPEGEMDPKEVVKMMTEMSKPGEHHKELEKFLGKWDVKIESAMPGMEAMNAAGTMVFTPMWEGRYIKGEFKGELLGMKFEGLAMMGYSSADERHEGTWMDSIGNTISFTAGECDEHGKVFTGYGTETDPMTHQTMKFRDVTEFAGKDRFAMTRSYIDESGAEFPGFTITYTRAK